MKKIGLLGMLILFLCTFSFISCDNDELSDKAETIQMYVSAETGTYTPWGSETPVECMLVKEVGELEFAKLAFGSIKGFDYEHGHTYELEVLKTTLANPPADGSNTDYTLLRIISDTPPVAPKPDELPEKAKFKLKMVQLTPFMNLDTPLAAPFDLLTFRILNHRDEYILSSNPEFLQYYDSIVMSSPILPNTYCIYQYKTDELGTSSKFTTQWSSYFFEKSDFQISLKGYKDNKLKYEYTTNQIMRERDFLGVDWMHGDVILANSKTNGMYCILDNRYEYLLTDTREANGAYYIIIKLNFSSTLTDTEYLKKQKTGLRWLLEKHLGEKTSLNTADFKTVPEDVEFVETYENKKTRVALLHRKSDDTHEECYYVIAESK